ncbi:hypothetical protein C2S53_017719 [Perilla frutescens var. hirtella]|uniref:PGG domain-containing protein n=1 Tax=Perilla frutescens var. hirtella TaxID=608512 RepID=A0AAD4IVW6_PERFH|nr:hypothetical protein C2S53_017719 [Perilla frutescens var. hirtella]
MNSKSGRKSYGPKWQNAAKSGSDSESEDDDIHSSPAKSTATAQSPNQTGQVVSTETAQLCSIEDNENQIQQGDRTRRGLDEETMYRAAIEGDWVAAEILLSRNPNLARDYVTDEGERALHVAVAMKHKKFVEKLINIMNEDDLSLLDGRGYTACCYAAVSGVVEIARVMIEKKPNLVTTHDKNNVTPLHKAALCGNMKMVSYLFKSTKIENLSNEEWFDLLLVTIREKMFDVALELVEKNNVLATMAKEERTALHVLAQLDISNIISSTWRFRLLQILFGLDVTEFDGKKPSNFVKLAEKLWVDMQKMEKNSLLKLIKKQHILHDAAKVGHVELLTMLTRTYPQLILDTDSNGHTIFHIAVTYRQLRVFNLIHQVEHMIHSRTISPDQDGNNILHLAAKQSVGLVNRAKLPPFLVMQSELAWFELTKTTVPPSCLEMRNADGLTPRELFSKEHERLLRDSKTWMMNSADSYMLIATIVFSVLFAAAFSLPGGYDSQTGKAILSESKLFRNFFRCELIGLACSVISILLFRSIMTSSFAEDDFRYNLPFRMFIGFQILLASLILAVTAFMSSFELVSRKIDHVVMWHARAILYLACYIWVFRDYGTLLSSILNMPRKSNRSSRHTLFNYHSTG